MASLPDDHAQSERARYLFACAIAGVILYVILDAVVQSLPPHYSPISQAESDLAVGPYGYVMTLNFINRGVLSLCFLFGVVLTVYSTETANARLRRGAYAFAVWSVGALLLAAFPTDVPATPVSWHGAIHLLVAILAFLGGAFGALYISLGMVGSGPVARARSFALPLAVLSVFLCLVELLGPFAAPGFFSHYGGLVERVFLSSVLLWVTAVSVKMLANPPLPKGPTEQSQASTP
ncbi:MAG TPA: DUF998 domain-containing protein [Nitrososphaerales archaeon]|nr:DUF998 domain-containing protein [Nitrososphaerales archaeon]